MAARHDALAVNPVQQAARIHREKSEARSLTLEDLTTVREALRAWTARQRPGPKASSDMADMADMADLMLATGGRIGEMLALRWADVALDAARPNVTISGTIKTEPRKGTYRKASPKSDSSVRTVVLPEFATAGSQAPSSGSARESGRRRFSRHVTEPGSRSARSNAAGPRSARTPASTGSPHIIPEDCRDPDLGAVTAETASQQLGHYSPAITRHHPPSPAITREFYISKPAMAADVARVLEELAAADPPTDAILRG